MRLLIVFSIVVIAFCVVRGLDEKTNGEHKKNKHQKEEFKKCLVVNSVPVSMELLEKKAWTIVTHSNCDNCKHNNSLANMIGRSGQQTKCWNLHGKLKGKGKFSAPIKCHYSVVDEKFQGIGKCELQTKHLPKLGGGHTIFASDDETYIVGAFCIFGKENWWYIAEVKGTNLSPEKIEELEEEAYTAGFQRDNVVDKESDDVVFTGFALTKDCEPK